jgi:Tol biopolymer transport system component
MTMMKLRGTLALPLFAVALAAAPPVAAPALAGGTTELVSVSSSGAPGDQMSFSPALSADGRFVAFFSLATNLVPGDANRDVDVFVHNRRTGTTKRVSHGLAAAPGGGGFDLSLSADGRFVAFFSNDDDEVPGDTNDAGDVFVRDRRTGRTERVSVSSSGAQADGFEFSYGPPPLSADGRFVAFFSQATNLVPGDTNSEIDVFVRDRGAGVTRRGDTNN